MQVPLYQPLAPPQYLRPWLQGVLPGYQYPMAGGLLAAEHGAWAQILLKPRPTGVELITGMPLLPRLIMVVSFLAGLLPGIVFAIVYFVVLGSKFDAMRAQLAAALTGQPIPPGPGLPGSMAGAGVATQGAIAYAPPRPTSSINPLSPVWMFVLVIVLFGATGTAAGVAYDEGWDTFSRRHDSIARAAVAEEGATLNFKYRKKGKYPDDCPDSTTYGYYSGSLDKRCYGCDSMSFKPSSVPDGFKRVKRDSDWLLCPPLANFERELELKTAGREAAEDALEESELMAYGLSGAAGVLFLGFAGVLVLWLKKNGVQRKRRREELAAQMPGAPAM
jgi:hypothetical protein